MNYEKIRIWKEAVAVFLRGAKETTQEKRPKKNASLQLLIG